MNRKALWFTTVLISALMLLNGCEEAKTVAPLDMPQGNCVGKIIDNTGSPVGGATVLLVPDGYAPGTTGGNATAIDSTISNESGYYGFDVATSGKYNLLANDNHQYALRKDIPVNTAKQTELPDEKLQNPGSLSGTVQLEGLNNNQSAIILLRGTNTFTSPYDASGNFTVAALAPGTYDLRILSTTSGFAVGDTTITITSGVTTTLPAIHLPHKQVAKINTFSVKYDPLMMNATLSWTTDNSNIVDSFNIYCNRENNIKPVKTTGSTVSSVIIDCISLPTDTLRYQIAAVGKDGWEGSAITGDSFVNTGVITRKELPFSIHEDPNLHSADLCFNKDTIYHYQSYIKTGEGWRSRIIKYRPDFTIEKQIDFDGMKLNPEGTLYINRICHDGTGNIYILIMVDNPEANDTAGFYLYKFDRDLNLVAKHLLSHLAGPWYFSLSVSVTGSVLLYHVYELPEINAPDNPFTTTITVFNPDFTIASETSHADYRVIRESFFRNDTVTAIIDSGLSSGQAQVQIVHFDASFNKITINHSNGDDAIRLPFEYDRLHICSGTTLMAWSFASLYIASYSPPSPQTILYFFNADNKIIARYPFPGVAGDLSWAFEKFYNDGDGNFYEGGETKFVRYSFDPVISKVNQ